MLFDEWTEAAWTDFLFAFKDELHIVLQQVVLVDVFKRLSLNERLSFIVVSTTRPDVSVFDNWLEWFGLPKLEWFSWHHVVVAVNQNRLGIWVYYSFCINHRIALWRHHFCFVYTSFQKQFLPSFGTAHHIFLMVWLCTYAWNAYQAEKLFEHSRLVFFYIFLYHSHWCFEISFSIVATPRKRMHRKYTTFFPNASGKREYL